MNECRNTFRQYYLHFHLLRLSRCVLSPDHTPAKLWLREKRLYAAYEEAQDKQTGRCPVPGWWRRCKMHFPDCIAHEHSLLKLSLHAVYLDSGSYRIDVFDIAYSVPSTPREEYCLEPIPLRSLARILPLFSVGIRLQRNDGPLSRRQGLITMMP